jgi:hypothetical protein
MAAALAECTKVQQRSVARFLAQTVKFRYVYELWIWKCEGGGVVT